VDSVTEFHDVTSNRVENSIDKKICVVHILSGNMRQVLPVVPAKQNPHYIIFKSL
jgi:hypothetical protein